MNAKHCTSYGLIVAMAAAIASTGQAGTITYTAADINGGDTNRTSFSDGDVTMTPLLGATPATFNANPTRLGMDELGTNGSAFNDPDTDPNNGNEEKLQLAYAPTAGLSQIQWDFSRADGAAPSGVSISGFSEDPVAFFSGRTVAPSDASVFLTSTYDDLTGTVSFELPFLVAFAGQPGAINFAIPEASAGQTLTVSVSDTDEGGAQLAILSITHTQVPEPTAATLALALAGAVAIRRR